MSQILAFNVPDCVLCPACGGCLYLKPSDYDGTPYYAHFWQDRHLDSDLEGCCCWWLSIEAALKQ